ncbi:MAG: DNA repair protein RadC [Erysipelotrichaceae bacterium]|nr:DNA repair protein RadC [Bacilli bacterium]NLV28567.1 DNA repair protein RadC [Erysipelotrichaceae bacterium]HPY79429.1 DNA repair protein RadC [Bacilli bacterium]HQA55497.1 DNA repair protein RadC [Bacilli bacterium]
MGQIRDLPPLERPREKAIRYGIESLSNVELLAIIIGSGTKKNSALEIASKILSDKNGLINIFHCPYQDFIAYQGLNKASAIKLSATFELGKRYQIGKAESQDAIGDEKTIYLKYAPTLAREVQEKIVIIVLNRQKKIVYEHILSIGSENNVSCSMRDILRILVLNKGTYFYLIHNHPGNIIEPSEADIAFTSSIIAEAKRIGFSLLDHLIIGEKGAYSFKTNAFLSENK